MPSGSEQLSVRTPPQISSRHPGPIGKTATTAVNNLETSGLGLVSRKKRNRKIRKHGSGSFKQDQDCHFDPHFVAKNTSSRGIAAHFFIPMFIDCLRIFVNLLCLSKICLIIIFLTQIATYLSNSMIFIHSSDIFRHPNPSKSILHAFFSMVQRYGKYPNVGFLLCPSPAVAIPIAALARTYSAQTACLHQIFDVGKDIWIPYVFPLGLNVAGYHKNNVNNNDLIPMNDIYWYLIIYIFFHHASEGSRAAALIIYIIDVVISIDIIWY